MSIEIGAPDNAVCNDCENYDAMEGCCILDGAPQYPSQMACDFFEEAES